MADTYSEIERHVEQMMEMSKEEMENVQGGLRSGGGDSIDALVASRAPLNFFYNMGLPGC